MEIGRTILEDIRKLLKDRAVSKIHLSKKAEAEVREYLTIMYGTSFRKEGEKRTDPLKTLLDFPFDFSLAVFARFCHVSSFTR